MNPSRKIPCPADELDLLLKTQLGDLKREVEELRREVGAKDAHIAQLRTDAGLVPHDLKPDAGESRIVVGGVEVAWNIPAGQCTFRDLPVALMWVDTTLAGLMAGLEAMVGPERFALALQAEGRKSVESDWMLISRYEDFREGFATLNKNAAIAGWGDWRLVSYDKAGQECLFQAYNNWEGLYQKALGVCWGSGLLAGKFAGICTKLFGTNCWATQTRFVARGDACDEFRVAPSPRNIESEIESLLVSDKATSADMAVALQMLRKTEASLRQQISGRRQTEEALGAANSYNRSLIEASLDPLVTIGPDGKITDVNAATETATGRSRADLVGTDISDYFTEPEKAKAGYLQVFREGTVRDYPLELRHVNGTVTPVLYNASVYRDENNGVAGVFAAARDITHLKRAEEKLSHLAAIVESSDDAIIGKTLDERILSWNRGAERIYGYTAEESVGKSVSMVVPPDLQGELTGIMERVKRGERVEHFETTRRRKDGKTIHVALTVSPIRDGNGKIIAASTIARDITGRKRAEEEIQKLNKELEQRVAERTSQLELANKELEAFAYSVSHDLRAPLRSIDGFSRILLEDYADKLDGDGREHLDTVRAASQRMAQLIDDILQLSRITRTPLRLLPVDLSVLAATVAEDLRKIEPERTVEFDIEPGCLALADANLMRIVLENLVGNAWKFTGKTPGARIRFGMEVRSGTVVYFVRDNGVGFDMKYSSKLFGAFQRLHTANEFPGTGIGLASVQRIIHRHGGEVWIEGRLGEGTTVYFTIPQAERFP